MGKTHVFYTDAHCEPGKDNKRALWLARLILDIKPDVVVDGGDKGDMYSLGSFDKGKGSFHGASYQADVDAVLDFDEKFYSRIKRQKKKVPRFVRLWGNHDQRIDRVIDQEPHLAGSRYGIAREQLLAEDPYSEVVFYEGNFPGQIEIDGVVYSHYFPSSGYGNAVAGENHARALITKTHGSATCGHSHKVDWSVQKGVTGNCSMGLVGGTFQAEPSHGWAGVVAHQWWSGLVIKREVENGVYSPQFVSLKELEKEYGS